MKITGYHGTHKRNEALIKVKGYKSSKDDEYLGEGVYFFESFEFSNGLHEAKCWCKYVKGFDSKCIIVFEALIESDQVLDLVNNIEHIKRFDRARNLISLRLKKSSNLRVDEKLEDYRIIHKIRDKFEVVRAFVEGAKRDPEFNSVIIRRPQVQVCVRELSVIQKNRVVYRSNVMEYKKWTTGQKY